MRATRYELVKWTTKQVFRHTRDDRVDKPFSGLTASKRA